MPAPAPAARRPGDAARRDRGADRRVPTDRGGEGRQEVKAIPDQSKSDGDRMSRSRMLLPLHLCLRSDRVGRAAGPAVPAATIPLRPSPRPTRARPILSPVARGTVTTLPLVITAPGTYTLDRDYLNLAGTIAIDVRCSNVVIDGAGHLLDGVDAGEQRRRPGPRERRPLGGDREEPPGDRLGAGGLLRERPRPDRGRDRLLEHRRRDHALLGRGRHGHHRLHGRERTASAASRSRTPPASSVSSCTARNNVNDGIYVFASNNVRITGDDLEREQHERDRPPRARAPAGSPGPSSPAAG